MSGHGRPDPGEGPLAGKVAIVTGGARGLGALYARALAEAGAHIAVFARTEQSAAATVDHIAEAGGTAAAVACDVTDTDRLQAAVGEVAYARGRVDVLVNNAALALRMPFVNVTASWWDAHFDTNLRAPYLLAQAVAPHMERSGGGSIINITSGAATFDANGHSMADHTLYMISKAALNRMTTVLSQELASQNIAVNALSPGRVATEGLLARVPAHLLDQVPGRLHPPDVDLVRAAIVTLAGQDAGGITGQVLHNDAFVGDR